MILYLTAAAGILMIVVTMWACLVVGARMDEQFEDIYRHGREEKNRNDGDKKDEG